MLRTLLLLALLSPTWAQSYNIMPLGDSITQSFYDSFSYRYYLWAKLLDAGVGFNYVGSMTYGCRGSPVWPTYKGHMFDQHHEGHGGYRTRDLLAILPGVLQNYTPDIVLLHAGTNDVWQHETAGGSADNLKTIIDTLRVKNPAVTVVLAKILPMPGAWDQGVNDLNALIDGIAAAKTQVNSPVIVVDMNSGFTAPADFRRDGIHPSDVGEWKMAERWFTAIRGLIGVSPADDGSAFGMQPWGLKERETGNGSDFGLGLGCGVGSGFVSFSAFAGLLLFSLLRVTRPR